MKWPYPFGLAWLLVHCNPGPLSLSEKGGGGCNRYASKGQAVKFSIMMCSRKVWMRAKARNTQGMGVGMGRVLLRIFHCLGSESCQNFLKVPNWGYS